MRVLGVSNSPAIQVHRRGFLNTGSGAAVCRLLAPDFKTVAETFRIEPSEFVPLSSSGRYICSNLDVQVLATELADLYQTTGLTVDVLETAVETAQIIDYAAGSAYVPQEESIEAPSQDVFLPDPAQAAVAYDQPVLLDRATASDVVPIHRSLRGSPDPAHRPALDILGGELQILHPATLDYLTQSSAQNQPYSGEEATLLPQPELYIPPYQPEILSDYSHEQFQPVQQYVPYTLIEQPGAYPQNVSIQDAPKYVSYDNMELEPFDSAEHVIVPENAPQELVEELRRLQTEYKELKKSLSHSCVEKSQVESSTIESHLGLVQVPIYYIQEPAQGLMFRQMFCRVLQTSVMLNTVKAVRRVGKAAIFEFSGFIDIQNKANHVNFAMQMASSYKEHLMSTMRMSNMDLIEHQVAHSVAALSQLYYQVIFTTENPDASQSLLSLRLDKPLIGRVDPGQIYNLPVSISVTVTDAGAIARCFEGLKLRLNLLRSSRIFGEQEFQSIQIQQNSDFSTELDLLVKFGSEFAYKRCAENQHLYKTEPSMTALNVERCLQVLKLPLPECETYVLETAKVDKGKSDPLTLAQNKQKKIEAEARDLVKQLTSSQNRLPYRAPAESTVDAAAVQTSRDAPLVIPLSVGTAGCFVTVRPKTLPEVQEISDLQSIGGQALMIPAVFTAVLQQSAVQSASVESPTALIIRSKLPPSFVQNLAGYARKHALPSPLYIQQEFELEYSSGAVSYKKALLVVQGVELSTQLTQTSSEYQAKPAPRTKLVKDLNGDPDSVFCELFSIDFGCVYLQTTAAKNLTMFNNSTKPVPIFIQVGAPFKAPTSAVIQPLSSIVVSITVKSGNTYDNIGEVKITASQRTMTIRLKAFVVDVPLIMLQNGSMTSGQLSVKRNQIAEIKNVTTNRVGFNLSGVRARPGMGVIEAGEAVNIEFFDIGELRLIAEIVGREIVCWAGRIE